MTWSHAQSTEFIGRFMVSSLHLLSSCVTHVQLAATVSIMSKASCMLTKKKMINVEIDWVI